MREASPTRSLPPQNPSTASKKTGKRFRTRSSGFGEWSFLSFIDIDRHSRTLQSQLHELWLSPISIVETLTLAHKGEVLLPGDPVEWVAHASAGTKEAPFTSEVALSTKQFPFDWDPADRFLAATALVFDFTLVTADERRLGLGNIKTLANR
jgi:PIN domain nuclease of toxin-antitoxin system